MTRSAKSRGPLLALMLGLGAALTANTALAAKIGVAGAVKPDVTGTLGATTSALGTGTSLFTNQTVRTGPTGVAQLLFLDETSLSIGPQSDVKLDRFVYDPDKRTGSVVFETSRGVLRFISGSQAPGTYQLKTPVATIGFRGTIGEAGIVKGSWFILCVDGELTVRLTGSGNTYILGPGDAVIVKPGGTHEKTKWDNSIVAHSGETSFPILVKRFADDYFDFNDDPNRNLNDTLASQNPPPPPPCKHGYGDCKPPHHGNFHPYRPFPYGFKPNKPHFGGFPKYGSSYNSGSFYKKNGGGGQ